MYSLFLLLFFTLPPILCFSCWFVFVVAVVIVLFGNELKKLETIQGEAEATRTKKDRLKINILNFWLFFEENVFHFVCKGNHHHVDEDKGEGKNYKNSFGGYVRYN